AKATHAHVDGASAAEVVVAPDLAQQLLASEDARRVRREEAQELELLDGEVEGPAMNLGRVGGLVDDDSGCLDLAARGILCLTPESEANAGIGLGWPGTREDHAIDTPVSRNRREPALGEDEHDRHRDARGVEDLAE